MLEVTVRNPETGFTRTVKADADGNYRFPVPAGRQVHRRSDASNGATLGKLADVTVGLGTATTANVTVGAIDARRDPGARHAHRDRAVDVRSTESATNITREELERLPVERDISVRRAARARPDKGDTALLGRQCGISFGGSSVAENTVYINGLNVTDFYNRIGSSSVPYAFYKEFQVKTGGYSVEFGRTTGGVINAVTRSGTNEFEFGTEVVWEPQLRCRASRTDISTATAARHHRQLRRVRQHQRQRLRVRPDRQGQAVLLRAVRGARLPAGEHQRRRRHLLQGKADDGFWGAKVDWQINDKNLLELLAFSDENEAVRDVYAFDSRPAQRAATSNTASPTTAARTGRRPTPATSPTPSR